MKYLLSACLLVLACPAVWADEPQSAATKRQESFISQDELYTRFRYKPVQGLGYEEGVHRRDPSSIIKVDDTYYIWYTHSHSAGVPWQDADLWYAISKDGINWTERGPAVERGPTGAWDDKSVFTCNILIADGKYYLCYQAETSVNDPSKKSGLGINVVGMAKADSPDGPWTKLPDPILKTAPDGKFECPDHSRPSQKTILQPGSWDSAAVHDPGIIPRWGKYWLYYKGHGLDDLIYADSRWGVAVADYPEGPYVKSPLNPVTNSGHEVWTWPWKKGIAAIADWAGPEAGTVQYTEDGVNFLPMVVLEDIPPAGGAYIADKFDDPEDGQGFSWGLCHYGRSDWNFLVRFECDLKQGMAKKLAFQYFPHYSAIRDVMVNPDRFNVPREALKGRWRKTPRRPAADVGFARQYEADWESLSRHNASPEWFRDAKFGIYFHWGPYSVPAFGNEHYPRTMYGHPSGKKPRPSPNLQPGVGFQTYREHDSHLLKYGQPKDFEYHQLVPLFSASEFNAEDWADLFFLAGARFAGPVAMHHDGYAMWDSRISPWNCVDTGPQRDITGEIAKAIRKRGMKLVTTFHHARVGRPPAGADARVQRQWYYYGRQQYLKREAPDRIGNDRADLQKLYGTMPWEDFLAMWNGLLEEVIDDYQPDLIWFDSWLDRIPEQNRQKFAAYYLNAAQRWNKDVVITFKQEDLPQEVAVVDFEKGRLDELTEFTWLTDDTISAGSWTTTGSWSYTEELDIKSSKELIHTLIDIVSKNGNLLLNISPTSDGIIPEDQRRSLLGIGRWLRANGEAIYGTRPFVVYGEGPKRMTSSGHFVQMSGDYDAENIRFTTNGDVVYAIQMGWPGPQKEVTLKSFAANRIGDLKIKDVSLVDSPESIAWNLMEEGLVVTTPLRASNKMAICYRIKTEGLEQLRRSHATRPADK